MKKVAYKRIGEKKKKIVVFVSKSFRIGERTITRIRVLHRLQVFHYEVCGA